MQQEGVAKAEQQQATGRAWLRGFTQIHPDGRPVLLVHSTHITRRQCIYTGGFWVEGSIFSSYRAGCAQSLPGHGDGAGGCEGETAPRRGGGGTQGEERLRVSSTSSGRYAHDGSC